MGVELFCEPFREVTPVVEQPSFVGSIDTDLGGPPVSSMTLQLGPHVVDHSLMFIDLAVPEPSLGFDDEDLDIPWVELWKGGGDWFRSRSGVLANGVGIILRFVVKQCRLGLMVGVHPRFEIPGSHGGSIPLVISIGVIAWGCE